MRAKHLISILLATIMLGCGSGAGECEACQENSDCEDGLSCSTFCGGGTCKNLCHSPEIQGCGTWAGGS